MGFFIFFYKNVWDFSCVFLFVNNNDHRYIVPYLVELIIILRLMQFESQTNKQNMVWGIFTGMAKSCVVTTNYLNKYQQYSRNMQTDKIDIL